jgi:hypothetical protein
MDTKIGTMEMLLLQRRIRQHTFGYLSPKNLQKLNGMDAKVSRGGRQMKCDICGAELYEERKVCVPCYQKYYKEIIAYEKWQWAQMNEDRKKRHLVLIKETSLEKDNKKTDEYLEKRWKILAKKETLEGAKGVPRHGEGKKTTTATPKVSNLNDSKARLSGIA